MRNYIFFILFSGLLASSTIYADQVEEARQALKELVAEIGKIEQNIAKNTRDQKRLRKDMRALDTQIGALHREIRQSEKRVSGVKARAQQLAAKDKQLRSELVKQGNAFKQQARTAYLTQHQSKWKLMLMQNSVQDVGRTAVMYDYVNKARLQQIQHLNELAEKVQQNQAELSIERAHLQTLIEQQTEQQGVLKKARKQKEKAQSTLAQLIDQDQSRLQEAQNNQRAIKKLLGKLQKKSIEDSGAFASQKGQMRWPVKGRLLNRFGSAKNGSAKIAWDGVTIKAPRGSEIQAIYTGTVVFSDWFQGYGWLLIVDHGRGFMSLYAHAEGLNKSVGDVVKTGEIIALVGDSGGVAQPGLYFEIRRQGAPLDPAVWCTVPKLAYSS